MKISALTSILVRISINATLSKYQIPNIKKDRAKNEQTQKQSQVNQGLLPIVANATAGLKSHVWHHKLLKWAMQH